MNSLTRARKAKVANRVRVNYTDRAIPAENMVAGFRAIHGREIAQLLLKNESSAPNKDASRNVDILVQRLGLIDGKMEEFTQLAERHNISVNRVKYIFELMLRKAILSDMIRPELMAHAGLDLTSNEILKGLLRNRKTK